MNKYLAAYGGLAQCAGIDMAWGTLVSTASAAGGKAALDWSSRG